MPADFLNRHKDFASLLRIVADQMEVQAVLVEKDYWIMHCLYGAIERIPHHQPLFGGYRYPYRTAEGNGGKNQPQSR